jgi:predicted amidohydrolase YtcJ
MAAAALPPIQAARAQTADIVVLNGKVFTADGRSSLAEGFAVKDGRFIAVGTSAAMRQLAGVGSKVIDLHGAFVTPGLSDGHLHNEGGGAGFDLSGARSLADLLAAVARAAKDAPPGKPIVSNNDWHEAQLKEQRLPTAAELDQVAPVNPVVLVRGGHEYILNSVALRLWNISKFTPSPPGGEIGKSPDGELDGELIDTARRLVTLPPAPLVAVENVLATQRKLNAYGITSARIPGSYRGDLFQALDAMLDARRDRALTLRLNVYLPGIGVREVERMREILARSPLKQDEGDEWVRIGGVKLLVDGGFEGGHMTSRSSARWGGAAPITGSLWCRRSPIRRSCGCSTPMAGASPPMRSGTRASTRCLMPTRRPTPTVPSSDGAGRSSICLSRAPTRSRACGSSTWHCRYRITCIWRHRP